MIECTLKISTPFDFRRYNVCCFGSPVNSTDYPLEVNQDNIWRKIFNDIEPKIDQLPTLFGWNSSFKQRLGPIITVEKAILHY